MCDYLLRALSVGFELGVLHDGTVVVLIGRFYVDLLTFSCTRVHNCFVNWMGLFNRSILCVPLFEWIDLCTRFATRFEVRSSEKGKKSGLTTYFDRFLTGPH